MERKRDGRAVDRVENDKERERRERAHGHCGDGVEDIPAMESFVGEVFRLPRQPAPSFCYRTHVIWLRGLCYLVSCIN